jgi:mannosylglycerate hydrolase
MPVTVHLVSHTHWDREWYLPAARFRQHLVALVDELLDDPPPNGASFLLDGQTVVIDDYLDVRPERAPALGELLRSGRIEAGPWFVLADELIPCAESLVRNLLAGRRRLAAFGAASPPVLYLPDSFGHPAAMPALAAGFGLPLAIALRGYGSMRWPAGDTARWVAPGGDRVLFYHFSKGGYESGARLPDDAGSARENWRAIRDELIPRSTLGAVLLMNGADHHARQSGLHDAIAAHAAVAAPDELRASSLSAFAADFTQRATGKSLPEVRGELRDSYGFVWTLQGTLATRAHQKRHNAQMERLLLRDAEPWTAFASRRGLRSRRPLLNAAWRSLLLCHPHDTLCGCSTDEVARAMDARLDETRAQGEGVRDDAVFDLLGHDRALARERRGEWRAIAVVRNRAPRARGGVALIRLSSFLADVKVGLHPDAAPQTPAKHITPRLSGVGAVQVLARSTETELTESPRNYPDADLVSVAEVAAWIPPVPAYGIASFAHASRARKSAIPHPVRVENGALANERVSVRVHDDGRVEFRDLERSRTIADAVRWESLIDLGDEYTPSPRGQKCEPVFGGARVVHKGPIRGTIETRWTFRAAGERVTARVQFIVDADARFVRVHVSGENTANDHRLRVAFNTGVAGARVFADAMFGAIERVPLIVCAEDARMEYPLPTAPLQRYVSLFDDTRGATVYSDGLAEYEATSDGRVLVTLVRAVGELSRADLPERPGNAGWPTPTPEAQCRGAFAAQFALMLHGARTSATIDDIERGADDVLLPLTGTTLRSALSLPHPVHGVALRGEGLAFSCAKESEDGTAIVLRCVNLVDEERAGSWELGAPVHEAHTARLDETAIAPLHPSGTTIPFIAPARGVVTVIVR